MTSQTYHNARTIAERYGLSASWLAKLGVYGGGPSYIRVGRRILYDTKTFEQWLETHRRANTSETA